MTKKNHATPHRANNLLKYTLLFGLVILIGLWTGSWFYKFFFYKRMFWQVGPDIETDMVANSLAFLKGKGISGFGLPAFPLYYLLSFFLFLFGGSYQSVAPALVLGHLFIFAINSLTIFLTFRFIKTKSNLFDSLIWIGALATLNSVWFYTDFYSENSVLLPITIAISFLFYRWQSVQSIRNLLLFSLVCGFSISIKALFFPFYLGVIVFIFAQSIFFNKTKYNSNFLRAEWGLSLFLVFIGMTGILFRPDTPFNKYLVIVVGGMFISIGGISICISSLLPRLTHAIRCTTRYVFWTIIGFILGCIPAHGQIEATLKNIYKLAANDGTYGTGSTKTFLHSLKILILNSKCMIHESTLWFLILFVTLSICPFLLITKKYFQSRFLFFFLCTTLGAIACLTSSTLCMLNGSVGVSGRYWIPTHVFLSFLIFEIFNSSSSSIKFKAAFAGGFLIIGVYTGIIDFNSHNAFVAWSREKDSLIQSELSLLKETLRREPRVITIGEPDLNPASFYWWGNSKYAYDKLSPELILSYPRESFILTLSQEIFINRFESDKADIAILRSWLPDGPNLDFILALDKNIFSVSHKVISTPNDNGNFELINGAIYFIRRNKE